MLTFTQEEISLELIGALPRPERIPDESGEIERPAGPLTRDRILGLATSGKAFTLENCQAAGFNLSSPGLITERFAPGLVIEGSALRAGRGRRLRRAVAALHATRRLGRDQRLRGDLTVARRAIVANWSLSKRGAAAPAAHQLRGKKIGAHRIVRGQRVASGGDLRPPTRNVLTLSEAAQSSPSPASSSTTQAELRVTVQLNSGASLLRRESWQTHSLEGPGQPLSRSQPVEARHLDGHPVQVLPSLFEPVVGHLRSKLSVSVVKRHHMC